MQRQPVRSRMIASIGHDAATNILELEFVGGELYRYYAVPASVAAALLASDRIGAFVTSEIKPRYRCEQLGDELPRGSVRRR